MNGVRARFLANAYARTTKADTRTTTLPWNGNSGIPPDLVELVVDVVLDGGGELDEVEDVVVVLDVVELELVEVVEVVVSLKEVVEVLVELLVEDVVVVVEGLYANEDAANSCGWYAPHVAFTVYCPATHAEVPPATTVRL